MPSSGARSGTRPSRSSRGAGDGSISPGIALACGHTASGAPVVAFATGRKLYRCDTCGTLQDTATRSSPDGSNHTEDAA